MKGQVLFVQGAGEGAHSADAPLVENLRHKLRSGYDVLYPEMPDEDSAPYEEWKSTLMHELAAREAPVLVGHSVGASVILKFLSEGRPPKPIRGVFLLACPFWGGEGWTYEGYERLALPENLPAKLPQDTPLFLYHCRDDEIVPFDHLALYAQALPHATIYETEKGGHQFSGGLAAVAEDIGSLAS